MKRWVAEQAEISVRIKQKVSVQETRTPSCQLEKSSEEEGGTQMQGIVGGSLTGRKARARGHQQEVTLPGPPDSVGDAAGAAILASHGAD